MKVPDFTTLKAGSSVIRGDDSSRGESIGSNSSRQQVKDIPTMSMEAILDDLRNSFGQYSQKSLGLNVPIEEFVQLSDGDQILGVNREGFVTAIDFSSDMVRDKHYPHVFTGIVANSSETQAFLSTQEGWIIVLDISDIFRLRITSQIQCFNHPVDAIRILSSGLLIVYDFNGIIETFKLQGSQILKVEYIEYQTAPNASSMVSPNGEYLLFFNSQTICVVDRMGNKIYESDRETRNCCLSDNLFAYMTDSLEECNINVRKLDDPFYQFLTISPDKRDSITKLYLSEDSEYVMGVIDNQSSKIWDLSDQRCEGTIDLVTHGLIQLKLGENRTILYSTVNSFSIDFFVELSSSKSVDLDKPGICTENLQDGKIVISSWNCLKEINPNTGNTIEFFLPDSKKVTALKYFDENIFCVGISNNDSYMIRMKSLNSPDTGYERYIPLDSEAMCIEITKDKDLIFVGCFSGEIVTIETNNFTIQSKESVAGTPTSLLYIEDYGLICGLDNGYIQKIGRPESFECHSYSITSLACSSKGMLVSCSADGRIGIWSLEDLRSISFLDFPATTIKISKNGQYLYFISKNGVFECWCLETLNCIFTEDYSGYNRFFITESERHIVLIDQTSLKIIDGPLMETIRVTGTTRKKDFIEYTRNIITEGIAHEFEEEMENGVILPFMITPLYLYAYLNLAQHLEQSLSQRTSIFNSYSGLNPLKIAAEADNGDCFKLLIKSLQGSQNPHALSFVNTNTLISLNNSTVPCLSKLYDLLFQKSRNSSLGTFISSSTKLPLYKLSDNKKIEENEYVSEGIKNIQKVAYWESQFKMCFESELSEDAKFLTSIGNNTKCLTSNFMNKYLSFRWKKVWWMSYLRFCVYFAYLFLLAYTLYIDIEQEESRSSYMNWVIILTLLIIIPEIFLLYKDFPNRFLTYQFLLEVLRSLAVVMYVASFNDDDDDGSDVNYLNYFTIDDIRINMVGWSFVTGFSYFTAFDSTRHVAFLILQVAKDLKIYLVLLAYTTFCISCVLYVILDSELKGSSADYFLESFGLSLGNFDVEIFFGKPLTAIFCLSMNTLVMLNLVIAIIGDSYDKVEDDREATNNKALIILIIEAESLMVWKRRKESLKYFQMCDKDNTDSGKTGWLGRIRELRLVFKNYDKNLKETKRSLEQTIEKYSKKHNDKQLKSITDQILNQILTKLT